MISLVSSKLLPQSLQQRKLFLSESFTKPCLGFPPSFDLLRCGFSLSVWLVRNEENEVLDLEFFVVWELWEMHAAERIRTQVWDFEF